MMCVEHIGGSGNKSWNGFRKAGAASRFKDLVHCVLPTSKSLHGYFGHIGRGVGSPSRESERRAMRFNA